jgi:hypothetical protein
MELHHLFRLGGRAVQRQVFPPRGCRHHSRVVGAVTHFAGKTADEDVAKLVGASLGKGKEEEVTRRERRG